jgi:hypothetical protein
VITIIGSPVRKCLCFSSRKPNVSLNIPAA